MKKKRCLIFGSNGFIAQSFSNNHNLKKKFDIIKFPKQKINLLKDSCLNKLDSTIKNGDYILFLAGEVPCRNLSQLENNVKMITNFLKIVQKKKYPIYHM